MSIQKPTTIKSDHWIYEPNDYNPSLLFNGGKWTCFFNKKELNDKWKKSVILFRQNKLCGIKSLQCSTSLKNTHLSSDMGVIYYHCTKSRDQKKIIKIGNNIVDKLHYQKDIFYKTKDQYLFKSNIHDKNYTYKINYVYNAFENDSDED